MNIHPTAIIAPEARLHPSVKVGPYAVIGPDVEIGENTQIGAHSTVIGWTTIGRDNVVSPHVAIGCPPQDIKYAGQRSTIHIGDGNHFREFVTIHLAEGEGNDTRIGDKNLLMAYVHIAHNCHVGSNNIMANCTTLAGHVHVGDRAVMGGFTGIHQFCHVGSFVMIGGMTKVVKDVPPFIKLDGNPARVVGLNIVGLRRNGVPRESLDCIRAWYKHFFRSGLNVTQAKTGAVGQPWAEDSYVKDFFSFLANGSKRGIHRRTRESSGED